MKKKIKFSNWREDLREVVDIPSSEPKTDNSERRIEDKKVNNKIVINPQMVEAFEEIGVTILEVIELDEKLTPEEIKRMQDKKDKREGRKPGKVEEDMSALQMKRAREEQKIARIDMMLAKERKKETKSNQELDTSSQQVKESGELIDEKITAKTDMGDVIKDFYKSDAPQFKGKSKEKRRQMAIAAKLTAERGGKKLGESAVPGKPAEKLGAVTGIPKSEQEAAAERIRAKIKAKREKMKESTDEVVEERKPEVETQGKKVAGYEKEGKYKGITDKFRQENPGSRQPKQQRGSKPSEGDRQAAQRSFRNKLQMKYGRTTKQKREAEIMSKHTSPRD